MFFCLCSENNINREGVHHLAEALKENTTLEELNLSGKCVSFFFADSPTVEKQKKNSRYGVLVNTLEVIFPAFGGFLFLWHPSKFFISHRF